MIYDISKHSAPKMPELARGTEYIKILLSQVSKDMHEPFVPMFFPVLGAHISDAEFQYPDNSWKEMTGMMANLVANSGDNKGQLAPLVEAICRDFRQHDKAEEDKYREWQKLNKTEPNNKKKTAEPSFGNSFSRRATKPRQHVQIPGHSTCRLQRQQKRDKKLTLLFNNYEARHQRRHQRCGRS